MTGFEVFPRQRQGALPGPAQIRVGNHGELVLNSSAADLLRDCGLNKWVQLLSDPENDTIALKPTTIDDPNRYSTRTNGAKTSRGLAISARAFVAHVRFSAGTILAAEQRQGMLLAHRFDQADR